MDAKFKQKSYYCMIGSRNCLYRYNPKNCGWNTSLHHPIGGEIISFAGLIVHRIGSTHYSILLTFTHQIHSFNVDEKQETMISKSAIIYLTSYCIDPANALCKAKPKHSVKSECYSNQVIDSNGIVIQNDTRSLPSLK